MATTTDLDGERARSLFGRHALMGVPGKWMDAATCEHGDLLDLIRHRISAPTNRAALDDACASSTRLTMNGSTPVVAAAMMRANRIGHAFQCVMTTCAPESRTGLRYQPDERPPVALAFGLGVQIGVLTNAAIILCRR